MKRPASARTHRSPGGLRAAARPGGCARPAPRALTWRPASAARASTAVVSAGLQPVPGARRAPRAQRHAFSGPGAPSSAGRFGFQRPDCALSQTPTSPLWAPASAWDRAWTHSPSTMPARTWERGWSPLLKSLKIDKGDSFLLLALHSLSQCTIFSRALTACTKSNRVSKMQALLPKSQPERSGIC